jgi:hypothetical protein
MAATQKVPTIEFGSSTSSLHSERSGCFSLAASTGARNLEALIRRSMLTNVEAPLCGPKKVDEANEIENLVAI